MKQLLVLLFLLVCQQTFAHQPVMDMAPRWSGGYGIQARTEHFDSETTTWIEGVYTFDRSVRATFKLPYREDGFGDLIVGLPLKKYTNAGPKTSNWSVTPSVRLPTGKEGDWDAGLSLSYSAESPSFYQLYDFYAWQDVVGLDINFGFAFPGTQSGMFALWDVSVFSSDDGDRIQTGPAFVYFKNNIMLRAEYKALAYEHDSAWDGGYFSIGFGLVY